MPCDPGPAAFIGAGFTGLSCARRLAELHPGDNIVVLEATQIANGPAGRNSGFMIDVPHVLTTSDYAGIAEKDQRDIRLNRAGIDYALDAKAAYNMPDEAATRSGKINGSITSQKCKL